MPKMHVADETVEVIRDWIERTTDEVAAALLDSPLSPMVAQPSRAEQLAYFRSKLYLPDGTPNPAGRDEILARYGPQGYEAVALAVSGEPAPLPDVPQEAY
jgi:hypothetical protein